MRRYETIIIIRPSVGEDGIKEIIGKYADIITNDGGHIVKEDHWGAKTLAYPIDKEQQGYYICLEYASVPESVSEIERLAKLDDRLLKYMTVKLQDVYKPYEEAPTEESPAAEDTDEGAAGTSGEDEEEAELTP